VALGSIQELLDGNEHWVNRDGYPFICQRGDTSARLQTEEMGQMAENYSFNLNWGWNFVSYMVGNHGVCGWAINACDLT